MKAQTITNDKTRTPGQAFTQEDKAIAISAMLATNRDHPYSSDSVSAAAAALGVDAISKATLYKWMQEMGPTIKASIEEQSLIKVAQETYDNIRSQWSAIRKKTTDRILADEKKWDTATLRDLGIMAGIATDHERKATQFDDKILSQLTRLQINCNRLGLDAILILDEYNAALERHIALENQVGITIVQQEIKEMKERRYIEKD